MTRGCWMTCFWSKSLSSIKCRPSSYFKYSIITYWRIKPSSMRLHFWPALSWHVVCTSTFNNTTGHYYRWQFTCLIKSICTLSYSYSQPILLKYWSLTFWWKWANNRSLLPGTKQGMFKRSLKISSRNWKKPLLPRIGMMTSLPTRI